jgi:protein TonB
MRTPAFAASLLLHAAAVVACVFVATGPARATREETPRIVEIRIRCAGEAPGSAPAQVDGTSPRPEELVLAREEPLGSPPAVTEPVPEAPSPRGAAPAPHAVARPAMASSAGGGGAGTGAGVSEDPGAGHGDSGSAGPVASSNPAPAYPRLARKNGWEGRVVLRVRVSPAGRPVTVVVATSSGHACLDDAAVDAVKRWQFEPARQGGAAVEGDVEIPLRFELTSR